MDIKPDELINVATLGINTKMSQILDYFCKHSAAGYCKHVTPAEAQVIILDIDSLDGKTLLREMPEQYRDKALIVLSVNQPERDDVIYVKKPLKAETLLSAINNTRTLFSSSSSNKIYFDRFLPDTQTGSHLVAEDKSSSMAPASHLQTVSSKRESKVDINLAIIKQGQQELEKIYSTKTVRSQKLVESEKRLTDRWRDRIIGTAPDVNLDNKEDLYHRSYNPDDYLQGFLHQSILKAKRYNKPVLQSISEYSIIILPNADTVLIDARESQLQALSSIPLADLTMTVIFLDDEQLKKYSTHAHPIPLYDLLWKSALIASRGRIPVDTDLYSPINFSRWSSISSHVLLFKHADTIATLWQQESISLVETLQRLNIPQRYVFAFYSACKAIGIVSANHAETEQHNSEPLTQNIQKTTIMNKFFNKFRPS